MSNQHNNNETAPEAMLTASSCFFLVVPCIEVHLLFLTQRKTEYVSALQAICESGVVGNLSQPTKARILAALQIAEHHGLVERFLQHCDVVEVTKCCQILDRPRFVKQLERRISTIEQEHPRIAEKPGQAERDETEAKKKKRSRRTRKSSLGEKNGKRKKRRVDEYRAELKNQLIQMKTNHGPELPCFSAHKNSGVHEMVASASLTGAFAKKVRRWVRNLKMDFLEFIVLSGSFEYWKALADLVHFSPKDFSLPYFLSVVHGGELPKGSFVERMKALGSATDQELILTFKDLARSYPKQLYESFNFLRTQKRLLRNCEIACLLAENISLSSAVWYLEELAEAARKDVPRLVTSRLRCEPWMDQSSKVTESFGKLLERILTFKTNRWNDLAAELIPAAERRLAALKDACSVEGKGEGRTVIFGDKSYSMTAAIQAATILAAMVSACFDAELLFFDHDARASPHTKPGTVKQVLNICQQIRASGGTSLAAALWPYYSKQVKVDRIILVTDEEENTPFMNLMFAKMLAKYKEEVSDAQLIVVCVGKGDEEFRQSLKRNSIEYKSVRVDATRPDLSKFDSLLNQIALLSKVSPRSGGLADERDIAEARPSEDDEFVML